MRQFVLPSDMALFEEKIEILEEKLEDARKDKCSNLPSNWNIVKHDRALIFAVAERGISFLK